MMQSEVRILQLPKITDPRGNLSVIEQLRHIPFGIASVDWFYEPQESSRREEFIVALAGRLEVTLEGRLEDAQKGRPKDALEGSESVVLDNAYCGLYVPEGCSHRLAGFSEGAIALVLSSESSSDSSCLRAPFPVRRVFYTYDIPGGEDRGGHAHKECHQYLVAVGGAFDVELDDGVNRRTVRLDSPSKGLHIPPGIWASEKNYSEGSVCLVLASEVYDEADYIRNYEDYLNR